MSFLNDRGEVNLLRQGLISHFVTEASKQSSHYHALG